MALAIWKTVWLFPNLLTDRQQPATDSDAWDPLSHIDHPWESQHTHKDAHKHIPVQLVCYSSMQATPAVAEIGHNSQRTNVNLYFYRMLSLYIDIVKQHKALFRHVPHLSVKMTVFFYGNDFTV